MPRDRIEKTLIVLNEGEVRQALLLSQQGDQGEILRFMTRVIAKKVEAALRKRC
jgi:hypothetical protein